jgi:Flp pilus assembly protein TadD
MSLFNRISAVTVVALMIMSPLTAPAFAAGSDDGSSAAASVGTYAEAKGLVYKQKYTEARAMLEGITRAEPRNADAWNMLGFSSRKMGDLKFASKAYAKALKLNPGHLGALEYQGEMFIQMGDGAKAKANLVTLQGLCGNCEEMLDLQKALKAAGMS